MKCDDKDILVAALKFGDTYLLGIEDIEESVGISLKDRLPYKQAHAIDAAYADKKIDQAEFRRITAGSTSKRLSCILTHLQNPSASRESILINALEHDNGHVRTEALYRLLTQFKDSKTAEDALISAILKNEDESVRYNAATGLTSPKTRSKESEIRVLQKLVWEMLHNNSATARVRAARALDNAAHNAELSGMPKGIGRKMRNAVIIPKAIHALQRDKKPEVRLAAAGLLWRGRGSITAEQALIKAMLDKKEDPNVRAQAASVLRREIQYDKIADECRLYGALADPKAAEMALTKAMHDDTDPKVRSAAKEALESSNKCSQPEAEKR